MTTPPKWFTDACASYDSDEEAALDIVYDNLDAWLRDNSHTDVNALMAYAAKEASNIPTDLLFGIITLTDHGRHLLSLDIRYALYEATKRVVEERDEMEEGVFRGFTFSKPLS